MFNTQHSFVLIDVSGHPIGSHRQRSRIQKKAVQFSCTSRRNPEIAQLTACSRVFLEKLPVSQLVKQFPAFCAQRMFVAMFTAACHWSLSWARWSQSAVCHPTAVISARTLSCCLCLGLASDSFPTAHQNLTCMSSSQTPRPLHVSWFEDPNCAPL